MIRLLLLTLLVLAIPATSFAQFAVSISIAPPALPVYAQPMAPADGYLWTPGYWAYGDEGYFWVPGTWVMAPEVGLLWTPGYWGWGGNGYAWNGGYWGTHVGFYGGVAYGFGYGGVGYEGGYWNHGSFNYNRSVNNVNVANIHNVYNKTVINTSNHVSFNGGRGGISARPTQAEEAASHEQHRQPTASQTQHVQAASTNHALLASVNHGRPAIAATAKPGNLNGREVVAAKQTGAPYKVAETHAASRPAANNTTPHTEKSAARTETARSAPVTRSNVPRPSTSSDKGSAAHAQSSAPARPAARQESASRQQPRAQTTSRPAPVAHAQPAARQESAPRPSQSVSRSAPASHSQPAARQESSPRPQGQARAQSAPRPAEKEAHAR
jgi:hypothetical protein